MNKHILIISPEKWSELYVSKHHYARYLSKKNTVWFLNSVGNKAQKENVVISKHETYNIYIINYKPIVKGINKLPLPILNWLLKLEIYRIKKEINTTIDVVWSFDPNRFWNLNFWKAKTKIYHTVDFHNKARFQNITCKTADIVLGIADLIIQPLIGFNKNIHKINHGVDYNPTSISNENIISLPGKNIIKAAYLGNLHKDVNYSLLNQLSIENSTVDFILIGPYQGKKMGPSKISNEDFELLSSKENIFFIGEIKSYEIPSYLKSIDINLLLFNDDAQIKHCNPHKLMFYLLSGKVVVSNIIDEYKNSDLLEIANSIENYAVVFKNVATNIAQFNNPSIQQKRIDFALDNTYQKQLERIDLLLSEL